MSSEVLSTKPDLTPSEASKRLGISQQNVNKLMVAGRIRYVDIGTSEKAHRRTSEAWLADFLNSQPQPKKRRKRVAS
jgi:excisionase family DNA binding protein